VTASLSASESAQALTRNLTAITVLSTVVLAWYLGRSVAKQVRAGNAELGSVAAKLGAVSSSMAGTAEETAAQAHLVAASAEEVSSNVGTVATAVARRSGRSLVGPTRPPGWRPRPSLPPGPQCHRG
jgi:methyl-accepting chemotaxis protein